MERKKKIQKMIAKIPRPQKKNGDRLRRNNKYLTAS